MGLFVVKSVFKKTIRSLNHTQNC